MVKIIEAELIQFERVRLNAIFGTTDETFENRGLSLIRLNGSFLIELFSPYPELIDHIGDRIMGENGAMNNALVSLLFDKWEIVERFFLIPREEGGKLSIKVTYMKNIEQELDGVAFRALMSGQNKKLKEIFNKFINELRQIENEFVDAIQRGGMTQFEIEYKHFIKGFTKLTKPTLQLTPEEELKVLERNKLRSEDLSEFSQKEVLTDRREVKIPVVEPKEQPQKPLTIFQRIGRFFKNLFN